MASPEQIEQQQQLLEAHRATLAARLNQQALLGVAHTPPEVIHDIREARASIERIKDTLRDWGVAIEDHPDDESPEGARRKRIFISYKRNATPDEPLAMLLVEALRAKHDVFIDQAMPIGADWVKRIDSELRRADFLITLLSETAIHSEMLKGEIETAHREASLQGGRPALLPVRVAYREPFQYPLSAYLDKLNWAYWGDQKDTPRLLAELERAFAGGDLSIGEPQLKARLLQARPPAPLPRPLPDAPLELPEGTMAPDSAFYVERKEDALALETIANQGVTITIKGPRQMGKSSLLIRTVAAATAANKRVAFLDFQLFDRSALADADRFFRQFCSWLSAELDLEDRSAEYWNTPLGNSQRCTRYVGRAILRELGAPLVLAMDEVETIFDTEFRSDFFGMLRSWHNSRATSPIWRQLDLALVTSTEPYQLIDNLNQSPFNVGQVIDLVDFSPEQIAALNRAHGAPLGAEQERLLLALLAGHPYLTRRALYLVASKQITAAELFMRATSDHGPFGDHLRYHLFRLHDDHGLVQGLHQVIRSNTCADERIFFRLRGAGLVRRVGHAVLPRCRLYAHYFQEHLPKG
jgi:hypothetical protein